MKSNMDENFEFWTAKRVQKLTGYSRVSLWRKSRDEHDEFPTPYRLSGSRVVWRSDEILHWMRTRPAVKYAPTVADDQPS